MHLSVTTARHKSSERDDQRRPFGVCGEAIIVLKGRLRTGRGREPLKSTWHGSRHQRSQKATAHQGAAQERCANSGGWNAFGVPHTRRKRRSLSL